MKKNTGSVQQALTEGLCVFGASTTFLAIGFNLVDSGLGANAMNVALLSSAFLGLGVFITRSIYAALVKERMENFLKSDQLGSVDVVKQAGLHVVAGVIMTGASICFSVLVCLVMDLEYNVTAMLGPAVFLGVAWAATHFVLDVVYSKDAATVI